ncbi:phosphatidylethanolamine-binding protein 4 isoform X2 [Numida meleagris]|uniref:phosphatidylethanolamine-binding protein 4 isoform X2 n=1 Tax=Numida meleagris TaxID=8996 RepID=UPI000B3DC659|nr:phosphatidylethanolamine-binding protein 4 isoform X2 [Numida meleagris]
MGLDNVQCVGFSFVPAPLGLVLWGSSLCKLPQVVLCWHSPGISAAKGPGSKAGAVPGSGSRDTAGHRADSMGLLAAALLAALLSGTAAWGAQTLWPDEPTHTCFFESLSGKDSEFCRGDLEVIYPELGDVGCTYIPSCHQSRWRISREWGSPRVRYPQADKSKKYVVMLVDPDAPSRADPRSRFWRHWLLADVPPFLKKCRLAGSSPPALPVQRARCSRELLVSACSGRGRGNKTARFWWKSWREGGKI